MYRNLECEIWLGEIGMKKVSVFVGSAHKKNTHEAVTQFVNHLQADGAVDCEIVTLSDYKLETCRGCRVCFSKGEEFCPLKDDRDVLFEKIAQSDGVVFASPNYTWHISGMMKVFLDRLGAACHRPRYFGKTFTSIVTQGIGRGNEIVKYFDFLATILGFNTVKGVCLTALDPRTEKDQQRIDRSLEKLSKRFLKKLSASPFPSPSLFMLMGFRMGRSSMKELLDESSKDYRYYAEKGWFDSEYYYPTHLNPIKKTLGNIFDKMAPTLRRLIA